MFKDSSHSLPLKWWHTTNPPNPFAFLHPVMPQQDSLALLTGYDGIFYDTYGEFYSDMQDFHAELPRILKPGGVYSFFNGCESLTLFPPLFIKSPRSCRCE